jgi:hypothetical protein
MLPVADLYKPDEIKEAFDRQKITPFDDPKFYFEILVPKNWDSRPHSVSKQDFEEAQAGKAMVGMAVFTPNSENEKDMIINVYFMRVPTRVQLADWMDIILKNMDCRVLARQRGEYNERVVEDALLEKDVEGHVLTRFTASRHGDYIFVVSGSAAEEQYPKCKSIFGMAAVTFNPVGMALNAPFQITDFKFLESKGGPERAQGNFKPKDKLYTTFEFTGFGLDQQGQPHVLVEMTASDSEGIQLFKPIKDEIRLGAKGKNPLGYLNLELPAYAKAGKYGIRIKAHDAVKNVDYELAKLFDVDGPPTVVSKQLEFRDCLLSTSKDGPPVKPLAVKPGDKVHSSSKIAGMQFREDKIDVQISLQVVGPLGEIIYEKPDLITLKDSYFYRPPTFFGEISAWIGLPSAASQGKYIWKYKMTDRVANTTTNYEEEFEVK